MSRKTEEKILQAVGRVVSRAEENAPELLRNAGIAFIAYGLGVATGVLANTHPHYPPFIEALFGGSVFILYGVFFYKFGTL